MRFYNGIKIIYEKIRIRALLSHNLDDPFAIHIIKINEKKISGIQKDFDAASDGFAKQKSLYKKEYLENKTHFVIEEL